MDKEELRKKFRRPAGALLLLLAAIEAKFFMFDVLETFKHTHDATVSYSEKGIFLPPLTFLLGLLMLVASDSQLESLRSPEKKLTKGGWVLVAAMLVICYGTGEWFKGEVSKLGFVSSDTLQLEQVK